MYTAGRTDRQTARLKAARNTCPQYTPGPRYPPRTSPHSRDGTPSSTRAARYWSQTARSPHTQRPARRPTVPLKDHSCYRTALHHPPRATTGFVPLYLPPGAQLSAAPRSPASRFPPHSGAIPQRTACPRQHSREGHHTVGHPTHESPHHVGRAGARPTACALHAGAATTRPPTRCSRSRNLREGGSAMHLRSRSVRPKPMPCRSPSV